MIVSAQVEGIGVKMREKGMKMHETDILMSLNMQKVCYKGFAIVCFEAQDMPNPLNGHPGTRRVMTSGYPGNKKCIRNSSNGSISIGKNLVNSIKLRV